MEIVVDNLCFLIAYDHRKLLIISEFNLFHALEMLHQQVASLGSDALYVVKLAVQGMLRALVAMEGDGIAVHLVLQACEHMEEFAIGIDADGHRRIAKEQFVGAMAVVFGESGNGNLQAKFALDDLTNHRHLTLSTIGYNQVG